MQTRDSIAESVPVFVVACLLALFAAVIAFAGISIFAIHYALGLDFGILVGGAASILTGITAFIVSFKKLRA